MIKLKSTTGNIILKLPTKIEEISTEYLQRCVEHVDLQDHYAIIALVYSVKVADYVYTIASKNDKASVGIMPILVAYKDSDKVFKGTIGNVVVVSNTDIERGYHISSPTALLSDKVRAFFANDKDLVRNIQTGSPVDEDGNPIRDAFIRMLQFKVIPINDIHATIKSKPFNEEFIEVATEA